jgi:phage FluMu protein Com
MWREYRCQLSAGSHKTGVCGGILFRVSTETRMDGRLEVKCHRCRRVQELVVEQVQYSMAYST